MHVSVRMGSLPFHHHHAIPHLRARHAADGAFRHRLGEHAQLHGKQAVPVPVNDVCFRRRAAQAAPLVTAVHAQRLARRTLLGGPPGWEEGTVLGGLDVVKVATEPHQCGRLARAEAVGLSLAVNIVSVLDVQAVRVDE